MYAHTTNAATRQLNTLPLFARCPAHPPTPFQFSRLQRSYQIDPIELIPDISFHNDFGSNSIRVETKGVP